MPSPSLDPAFRRFSVLEPPERTAAYMGICPGRSHTELMGYRRGTSVPAEPVRIDHNIGRRTPSEVIWIDVRDIVVAPRVLAVLEGFTGWSTYPVEVYDGRGWLVPGYVGIAITGRGGPMRSDLTRMAGSGGWAEYLGLWFPLDSWDGSDLFQPETGPGPVVTAPLAAALRAVKPSNLRIVPLRDYRAIKASVDWFIERGTGGYGKDNPQLQER